MNIFNFRLQEGRREGHDRQAARIHTAITDSCSAVRQVLIENSRMDNERFKILRRNSLRNEVDGTFDELEEFEDRGEAELRELHPKSS